MATLPRGAVAYWVIRSHQKGVEVRLPGADADTHAEAVARVVGLLLPRKVNPATLTAIGYSSKGTKLNAPSDRMDN